MLGCGNLPGGGRPIAAPPGVVAIVLLACACTLRTPLSPAKPPEPLYPYPPTRAERTGYAETSSYDDVVRFVRSLPSFGGDVYVETLGETTEGREIPLVIASRPLVATPEEARRLGRPVVYVQANIHGGEVEGKEALQALVRDLSFDERPNVLDSVVLLAVPIYNADGNEKLGPQSRHRAEQNGPETVGQRANGQGLDLNRDYVKAEAPETRASLALFERWDPDVFVDLHTTDGSFHGYALTYSPSLHPGAPLGGYTRELFLPELRRRVRQRRGFETFDYGNFALEYGADVNTDTTKQGWYTYDHRPRYGTNYYGLRNRVAVLSEAYSHDPFERRVKATYAFVSELLSLVAEQGAAIRALTSAADRCAGAGDFMAIAVESRLGCDALPRRVPLRSRLTTAPSRGDVIAEDLARAPDSARSEPGVPRGLRRTGRFRTLRIPVYDRFEEALGAPLAAAYVVPAADTAAVRLLRAHGVTVERLEAAWRGAVEAFTADSVVVSPRPFQGHREVRLEGRWVTGERDVPAGSFVVLGSQRLGLLAASLLEPQSDDGLAAWNVFDASLRAGGEFPVLRADGRIVAAPRRPVP